MSNSQFYHLFQKIFYLKGVHVFILKNYLSFSKSCLLYLCDYFVIEYSTRTVLHFHRVYLRVTTSLRGSNVVSPSICVRNTEHDLQIGVRLNHGVSVSESGEGSETRYVCRHRQERPETLLYSLGFPIRPKPETGGDPIVLIHFWEDVELTPPRPL